MGGGGDRVSHSTPSSSEAGSVVEGSHDGFSQLSSSIIEPSHHHAMDGLSGKLEDKTVNGAYGSFFGGEEAYQRMRRSNVSKEILQSYDQLRIRSEHMEEAKNKILSYTPGGWIEKVGSMELNDYDVPKTTTLLMIGPKGSGKSSLVNRISKVFEDDKFASERAQVSYNSSVGDGTYFLQEYMIPRGSNYFCLYDTRSLSENPSENIEMLKHWIINGVRHGELIIRPSDSSTIRARIKCKARGNGLRSKVTRKVNFVIFVLDGLAVLKSMDGVDKDSEYLEMIASVFQCPFLSFKDDKPVVVVTHGDLLSLAERARVRVHLGELLGIPPLTQIFDIPDSRDPVTDLAIVDMLRYSLEHADKNLPQKNCLAEKVRGLSRRAFLSLLIIFVVAVIAVYLQHVLIHYPRKAKSRRSTDWHRGKHSSIDWHAIRHLWFEEQLS